MTKLSITINKDIQSVWDSVKDINSHIDWMQDADTIELISGSQNEIGSKYLCKTKVGFLKTNDIFEIIKYSEPNLIKIYHTGNVSGLGYFKLNELDEDQTEFILEEDLVFPLYMGSIIGKKIAMLILHRIWNKNLLNLKSSIENKA